MSAILFPVLQFFDDAGAPLADGKIYFYESDGSTPQAAYTNAAGNVALSNPTTLDSAGRANSGAGIWLGLNLTYTIVVKDSDDATVLTLSNVTPNSAGIAPSGASYITATAESGLSAERVLTGTANQITVADGGSTATLSVPYQFNLGASASGPSELRLFEDTDNGSNKVTLTVAANIAADATVTIPATTGTVLLNTDIGTTLAGAGANTDITSVYLNNTGLKIKDTNASHGLIIAPGSDLTADKTLTLTTGDADRTLSILSDSSINGVAYVAGGTDISVTDGGTGVSTFNTAYSVIVAGTTATGALQSTASAGTSGQPLLSGGASALPAYGTLAVSAGGTGRTTLNANRLLAGGTTSTGVLQSINASTAGKILVSTGSSSLPEFTDILLPVSTQNSRLDIGYLPFSTPLQANKTSNNSSFWSTGTLYFIPFFVTNSVSYTTSNGYNSLNITTGAVESLTMGLYSSSGGVPSGSAISGSVVSKSTGSTGTSNVLFTSSINLTPGLYWFAFTTSNSTFTVQGMTFMLGNSIQLGINDAGTSYVVGYSQSYTYSSGVLPTVGSLSEITVSTGFYCPLVFIK